MATTDLPSWVPDWRSRVSHKAYPLFESICTIVFVNSGGQVLTQFTFFRNFAAAPPTSAAEAENTISGHLLRLPGRRLTRIAAYSRERELALKSYGEMERLRAIGTLHATIRADEQICGINSWLKKTYSQTGQPLRDVYWQTLCAGQYFVSKEDTKSGFEKWFKHIRGMLWLVPTCFLEWPAAMSWFLVWHAIRAALRDSGVWRGSQRPEDIRQSDDYKHFEHAVTISSTGRRMFRTEDGHLGLGPSGIQKGDEVFLIKGCKTPMVLRPTRDPAQWTLVGACYLHGFMEGEGWDEQGCSTICLS